VYLYNDHLAALEAIREALISSPRARVEGVLKGTEGFLFMHLMLCNFTGIFIISEGNIAATLKNTNWLGN
jgi:hypothetical protein